MTAPNHWLMKSEPYVYGIAELERDGSECWEGVRNFQARNLMRDEMRVGDPVLFYHSNSKPSGVAGLAIVTRAAYPDETAFDPSSNYYDAKSDRDNPRWLMVDVRFVSRFADVVSLERMRETPGLEDMMVTKRGMRLSIQPVTANEYNIVAALGAQTVAPEVSEARAAKARVKLAGGKKRGAAKARS